MIAIIGAKRLIILGVLLCIAALLAGLNYGLITPQLVSVTNQKNREDRKLKAVRSDLARIQVEFDQLDKQKEKYEALELIGFFSNQERSEVKRLFTEVQRDSKVVSAVVNVKSGMIENNPIAAKADHKILMSPVEIEVSALEDADIYRYIEILIDRFPGHLRLDNISIQRTRDVNAAVLRSVASGSNIAMVNAEIFMSWRTMIPVSKVIQEN